MPRLIKNGGIVEDVWLPVDPESPSPPSEQIYSLDQWLELEDKTGSAVQIDPGQSPAPLFSFLKKITLVAVDFPVFTDGRGFSYARELRERGYGGELRATGHFIRDQLTYLQRCGFDAFQMADESLLEESLASLADFSEHYQVSIDQPLPLFRRRV
ncbi:MAG: oxidoreductase [Gammaproteobacteria bacterium]|nr:MAG: oxidoreductase [Gammaproteobacteria bacterium]